MAMARCAMWRRVLLLAGVIAVASDLAAMAAGSGNATNDSLLAMKPDQQAKVLSRAVKGCAGIEPFPMGVVSTTKWKALAYWSVRCKDGRNFAVQIAPDPKAPWIVADCRELQGSGKECFKKF
jgi:hypothetical protein